MKAKKATPKPDPKAETESPPPAASTEAHAQARPDFAQLLEKETQIERLREKQKQISPSFPPVSELASLAATLAHGHPINQGIAKQFADQAYELWKACSEQRQKQIENQAYREIARENAAAENDGIPRPTNYPVTFDEFLRLVIGGRYKADREKTYRDYARCRIEDGHLRSLMYPHRNGGEAAPYEQAIKKVKPALLDEVELWMKDTGKRIYTSESWYLLAAGDFLRWRNQERSERGRKAATKRWSKDRIHESNVKRLEATP